MKKFLTIGIFLLVLSAVSAEVQIADWYPQEGDYVFICNPDFEATSFDWDFGDGQKLNDQTSSDVYHVYEDGEYEVTCTAEGNGIVEKYIKRITVGTGETEAATHICGNGVHEDGEQCDDGNTDDGDGCSATCTKEIEQVCHTLAELEAVCQGGNITIDVIEDGCRSIACDGGKKEVDVCPKDDHFEMYIVTSTWDAPDLCVEGVCIGDWGFKTIDPQCDGYDVGKADLIIAPNYPQQNNYLFRCIADAENYDWDFGDGQKIFDTIDSVYHTYAPGAYQVTCNAWDGERTWTDTIRIIVGGMDEEPKDLIEGDLYIADYYPQGMDYVFVMDVQGFTPNRYDWVFGDGHKYIWGSQDNVYHTYAEDGEYEVVATARDDEGNLATEKLMVKTGPVCGNGLVESGEECDDGNKEGGDGCSQICTVEGELCMESVFELPAACEDGVLYSDTIVDGCRQITCMSGLTSGASSTTALACNKPDKGNDYYEMYLQSMSTGVEGLLGNYPTVCLAYACVDEMQTFDRGDLPVCIDDLSDKIPPQILNSSPHGIVNPSVGSVLYVQTDEWAECRYERYQPVEWHDMTSFKVTHGTEHMTPTGTSYGDNEFYVMCRDGMGNTNDLFEILFYIEE